MAVVDLQRGDVSGSARMHGLAFIVWSSAVAIAVAIHEWQQAEAPWSLAGLAVLAAIGVLLRPWSVVRVMALLALLSVELLVDLPDVFNHTLIIGTVSTAIFVWWLTALVRTPARARSGSAIFTSISPFLRLTFVLAMYAAAFAKLNTGFLDPATTCAVWIVEAIPLVSIPEVAAPVLMVGAIATEFAIPTLLLFRPTRWLGIVVGIGFGVVTAVAGHAPFAGFGWTFYILFIPAGTLARVLVTARRSTPSAIRGWLSRLSTSPVGWVVVGAAALLAMSFHQVAPDAIVSLTRRYGASLAFFVYTLAWTGLLLRNWRHWTRTPPKGSGRLGVGNVIFAVTLAALLLNAASPYIGLKTRYSFTMFSNLQTEPGRWNHLLVPEAVRVFELQTGRVHFIEISDPALAASVDAYSGRTRWSAGSETSDFANVTLLAAQRLVADHPDAVIRYELDGVARSATPVAADPILGASVPLIVKVLGGFRPLEAEDVCQL